MILVVDHYDSFVFNLSRYFGLLGERRQVVRFDALTFEAVEALKPKAIVLSPGPLGPAEAAPTLALIARFAPTIPILGVCLGHQCLAAALGGEVVLAKTPTHGRASRVHHQGEGLFRGLPNPLSAGRYHSLAVKLPEGGPLKAVAHTEDGEVMAMVHEALPVFGVQFHPESVLTPNGLDLLKNFLNEAARWRR